MLKTPTSETGQFEQGLEIIYGDYNFVFHFIWNY